MILDIEDQIFSIRQQCVLLGLPRSTLYYEPKPISERDLELMKLLDEQQTETPFYGVVKMTQAMLDKGIKVGKCHVRTLLRKMGLFAIYPAYAWLCVSGGSNRLAQPLCAKLPAIKIL